MALVSTPGSVNEVNIHGSHGHLFGGWPTTDLGRWCVALAGVCVLGVVVMATVVASGQRGGKTISDNWWISAPALVAAVSAVGSFVTGLVAMLGSRERSQLVRVIVVVEGVVTAFLIGELAVAH
jgi:hypothetical protein